MSNLRLTHPSVRQAYTAQPADILTADPPTWHLSASGCHRNRYTIPTRPEWEGQPNFDLPTLIVSISSQPKIASLASQVNSQLNSTRTTVAMATVYDNNSYDLIWETIRTFLLCLPIQLLCRITCGAFGSVKNKKR